MSMIKLEALFDFHWDNEISNYYSSNFCPLLISILVLLSSDNSFWGQENNFLSSQNHFLISQNEISDVKKTKMKYQ